MAETLAQAIEASVDTSGDTEVSSTPATTTAPETTTPETSTPADTAPAATGDPEWKFDQAEFDAAHPELAPYRKQLQGSYTRAQQELAEQRKAVEGLDEGSIAWVRQVTQLAQTQPQLAAQMLEQERQRMLGAAPAPPPDPFEGQVWLSDGERGLHRELLEQKQIVQQLQQEHALTQIHRQFDALEKEIGRPIPHDERVKTAGYCTTRGIRDPADGWRAMNWNAGVQMGRDQAATVVAQKSGMGAAPGGVASREAPPGDREPKTQREAIIKAFEEAERRSA